MLSWVSNVLLRRQQENAAPPQQPPSSAAHQQQRPSEPIVTTPFIALGSLYSRHSDQEVYRPLCTAPGTLTLLLEQTEVEGSEIPSFRLKIMDEDKELMFDQPIEEGTQMNYHVKTACAMWPAIVENDVCHFAFQFADNNENVSAPIKGSDVLGKFVVIYNRFTYIQLTRRNLGPSAEGGDEVFDYLAGAGTASLDDDGNEAQRDEAVFAMAQEPITRSTGGAQKGVVNACFADSIAHNRALLLRVDPSSKKVTAEAHAYSRDAGFSGDAQSFQVPTIHSAKEALLSDNERSMFVLDDLQGQLASLDLERGAVVQTYAPQSHGVAVPLESVTYANKFASENPFLLTGISTNCGFLMDTRLAGDKCIVTEEGKGVTDYAITLKPKANKFSCHATSRNGYLVIGDASGSLRLYTGPPGARRPTGGYFPKTAKTLLDCAEPIVYLDVSADGELILATTPSQVLVLPTRFLEGDVEKNGFEGRMGKQKPAPLRLLPSPEQIAAMRGKHVAFTRAVFERNVHGEHWITASCGSYLCTWSLDAVRRALPHHNAVHCESRDTKTGAVRGFELEGDRELITFMSENAIGIQRRATETPTRRRNRVTLRL